MYFYEPSSSVVRTSKMAAILFIASKRRNYRRLFIDFIVSVNIYFLLDALCRQKFIEIYQRNIKNSPFYFLVTSFVVIGYEYFSFPVRLDSEQFGSLKWIPIQIHCSFIDLLNMLSLQFGHLHPLELLDTAWCLIMKISATRQQWQQLTYAVIHSLESCPRSYCSPDPYRIFGASHRPQLLTIGI